MLIRSLLTVAVVLLAGCTSAPKPTTPYVILLGTAQDGGSPQVNSPASHPARLDPAKRRFVSCIGLVDPRDGRRWLIEATPDFREQAWMLSQETDGEAFLDGVFITHAHMGHYIGLAFIGHESMGAKRMPVHVMPKMAAFLSTNGPWEQLVRYENIALMTMAMNEPVELATDLTVTPISVPHRQEYSEVVAFRIDGPDGAALFLPDIDAWEQWDRDLADELAQVDVAYLDATFYADGEIKGRDMSTFPHPRIVETMDLLQHLPARERAKVRFIHLNHTNPAQWVETPQRREIERRGYRVGERGERVGL